MGKLLKTKGASVFIQPSGANTEPLYGGCYDVSSFEIPDITVTPIRCLDDYGNGWNTIGERIDPPGNASATLSSVQFDEADYLDKLSNCGAALYIHQATCGKRGTWGSYARSWILPNFRRSSRSFSNLASRESDTEITGSYSLQAHTAYIINSLRLGKKATTETQAVNDISGNFDYRCFGSCGTSYNPGQYLVAPCDAAGGATANILLSSDSGSTWTAAAADPFAVGRNATAGIIFEVSPTVRRVLVSVEGTGGAVQGMVAYSDDWGTTWTTVNIGGAAVGHGATRGGGLFALDAQHIWLASASGYIYFSADGGLTWTAQESGTIAVGNYTQVHFADKNNGIAVGASGITAFTNNGGQTWYAGGVPVVANLNTCFIIDSQRAWVGTATGRLFYTTDGGTTWTERLGWVGAGTGAVTDIQFLNEYVGFMAKNSAAPVGTIYRTINGGYSWETLTTPTNAGINALFATDNNNAMFAGEPSGGTAFIGSADEI